MASSNFGQEKRPAGKQFRDGTVGEALDDLYGDIDRAFTSAEKGLSYEPVRLATAANADAHTGAVSATGIWTLTASGNGALTIDGVAAVVGDRVLIKDIVGAGDEENQGIYVVTDIGSGGTPWIMERAADLREQDDVVANRTVMVTAGNTLANSMWRMSTAPAVINVNDMAWTQTAVGTLAAGALSADAPGRALMADGYFTATEMQSSGAAGGKLAPNAFALDDADQLDAWKANGIDGTAAAKIFANGAIPADKLEAGGAATGVDSAQVRETANEVVGALAAAPGVPVVLALTIADAASGDNNFTGLAGKHRVIDAWVQATAVGDAGNTYQVQTGAGAAITDAFAAAGGDNDIGRAGEILDANAEIADTGTIRVAHVRNANSSAATVYVMMIPVA